MSGVPSQGAFSKRPSGISPYWSYSGDGSHRGVAADFSAGRLMISAFASFPGSREVLSPGADAALSFLPGLNVAWSGMDGQVSVTCYASSGTFYAREKGVSASGMSGGPFFRECRVSADARYSVRGVEVFSEAALDAARLSAAALAGCKFSIGDSFFLASGVRYYPAGYDPGYAGAIRSGSKCTNEYGASVSGSFLCGKYVQLQPGHFPCPVSEIWRGCCIFTAEGRVFIQVPAVRGMEHPVPYPGADEDICSEVQEGYEVRYSLQHGCVVCFPAAERPQEYRYFTSFLCRMWMQERHAVCVPEGRPVPD